jgi:WD40 repeat protein
LRQFGEGNGRILRIAAAPNGWRLLSAGDGLAGITRVWDSASGVELRRFTGHVKGVEWVAFAPDGRSAASCDRETGRVIQWDIETSEVIREYVGHAGRANCAGFSPDGTQLASAGGDGTVRLWDTKTGRQTQILDDHQGPVWCVAFSPDGRHLASGGGGVMEVDGSWQAGDCTIRLWELPTPSHPSQR